MSRKKKKKKKATLPAYRTVLDTMKEGDIWHALPAPEPYRYYPKNGDWDMKEMLGLGFTPTFISLYAHYESKPEWKDQRRYHEQPLPAGGIKIGSGYEKSTTRKEIRMSFDIPEPSRLAKIMADIKAFYGPNHFRVLRLVGYNPEFEKVNLDFRNFRPNGLEPNLYCKIIGDKYHCQMSLDEMQKYLADFHDDPSVCKLATVIKPVCGKK